MSVTLYLYCEEKLYLLKEHLNKYSFWDIAHFLDEYETVDTVKILDESDYSKLVIDISDLIQDGNYYRVFTLRYIRALGNLTRLLFVCEVPLYQFLKQNFLICLQNLILITPIVKKKYQQN